MSTWHWPQWTLAGLYALSLLIALTKDGEPRTGRHSLSATMLGEAVSVFILWSGGFFS